MKETPVEFDILEINPELEAAFKNARLGEIKADYEKEVASLKVALKTGERLDVDLKSQEHLTRAYLIMNDEKETIDWVDACNKTVPLTKSKIKEALNLAQIATTDLVLKYRGIKNTFLMGG